MFRPKSGIADEYGLPGLMIASLVLAGGDLPGETNARCSRQKPLANAARPKTRHIVNSMGQQATAVLLFFERPLMHIKKIFAEHDTTFSFEFFPPRTPEFADMLRHTIENLTPLSPSYVGV